MNKVSLKLSTVIHFLVSLGLLAPVGAKAEGGCPKGFVPIDGGYCRNIICSSTPDFSTAASMQKYGLSCGSVPAFGFPGTQVGSWGNLIVPKK